MVKGAIKSIYIPPSWLAALATVLLWSPANTVDTLNLCHENNNYFSRWRKIRKYLSEKLQKVTHD